MVAQPDPRRVLLHDDAGHVLLRDVVARLNHTLQGRLLVVVESDNSASSEPPVIRRGQLTPDRPAYFDTDGGQPFISIPGCDIIIGGERMLAGGVPHYSIVEFRPSEVRISSLVSVSAGQPLYRKFAVAAVGPIPVASSQ